MLGDQRVIISQAPTADISTSRQLHVRLLFSWNKSHAPAYPAV
jgi:hypothetical protein